MKKNYKFLALLFGIILLSVFLYQVDFNLVWHHLKTIGWQFIWTIVITGIAGLLAAYAWLLCFTEKPVGLSFLKLFVIRQVGETLAVINPTSIVAGETSKIFMLKKEGVEYKEGIVSILLSRTLVFLSMFSLMLFASFLLIRSFDILVDPIIQVLFFVILISAFIGLFYSLVSSKLLLYRFAKNLTSKFSYFKDAKWLPKLKEINEELHLFYANHKWKLFFAFLFNLIHWILGGVEFYVLLNLLKVDVSIFDAILVEVGVAVVKACGAFVPGQVGIEEYGNKIMLGIIGVATGGIWVAISILRRARQVVWLMIGGILFLILYKNWD